MASTAELNAMLARLRTGDRTANGEILAHCQDRFRCQIRRMLGQYPRLRRWEQTGDVAGELFLRLNKAMSETKVRTLPELLGLSAKHIRWELLDLIRRHYGPNGDAAHHATPADRNSNGTGDQTVTLEDRQAIMPDSATWHDFHQAVEKLDPEHRELLDLHVYQGLTLKEIGKGILGLSDRQVKRRWRQVRKALAKAMGLDTESEN